MNRVIVITVSALERFALVCILMGLGAVAIDPAGMSKERAVSNLLLFGVVYLVCGVFKDALTYKE